MTRLPVVPQLPTFCSQIESLGKIFTQGFEVLAT